MPTPRRRLVMCINRSMNAELKTLRKQLAAAKSDAERWRDETTVAMQNDAHEQKRSADLEAQLASMTKGRDYHARLAEDADNEVADMLQQRRTLQDEKMNAEALAALNRKGVVDLRKRLATLETVAREVKRCRSHGGTPLEFACSLDALERALGENGR